jgi:hypothetical protein
LTLEDDDGRLSVTLGSHSTFRRRADAVRSTQHHMAWTELRQATR